MRRFMSRDTAQGLAVVGALTLFGVVLTGWACAGCSQSGSQPVRTETPASSGAGRWEAVALPPNTGVHGIDFVTDETGYCLVDTAGDRTVLGSRTVLLKTLDAGRTWERMHAYLSIEINGTDTPVRGRIRSMGFADCNHGWLAGAFGVMRTTDGGATWRLELRQPAYALYVLDRSTAWVVLQSASASKRRILARYLDAWSVLPGAWPRSFKAVTLAFPEVQYGWAAGTSIRSAGAIVQTWDAGSHWPDHLRLGLDMIDLTFPSKSEGWAIGRTVAVPRTSVVLAYRSGMGSESDGDRWTRLSSAPSGQLHAVRFTSADDGWLAGDGIYVTHDGGENWGRQADATGVQYLDMVDASHGYAAGNDSGAGFMLALRSN